MYHCHSNFLCFVEPLLIEKAHSCFPVGLKIEQFSFVKGVLENVAKTAENVVESVCYDPLREARQTSMHPGTLTDRLTVVRPGLLRYILHIQKIFIYQRA